MTELHLRVASDFSMTPGPRRREEGPFSGEEFLDLLTTRYKEARAKGVKLRIDLDGTAGYATSFLEASFGGLARAFPIAEIISTLRFTSIEEPYLEDEITSYIEEARDK